MFRRGFLIGLPPLLALLGSVAVDSYQLLAARNTLSAPAATSASLPLPGPRRYPPAYRAGSLAKPYAALQVSRG